VVIPQLAWESNKASATGWNGKDILKKSFSGLTYEVTKTMMGERLLSRLRVASRLM
jgi:hypothetical protein